MSCAPSLYKTLSKESLDQCCVQALRRRALVLVLPLPVFFHCMHICLKCMYIFVRAYVHSTYIYIERERVIYIYNIL